ncbi:hypothetical protein [Microbacterium sediminis]|nr:hypothetical protein [Microbacterium sediminis]QBR73701.1 hypothetical protein E3O41_04210 [Microbacterium sediminis]
MIRKSAGFPLILGAIVVASLAGCSTTSGGSTPAPESPMSSAPVDSSSPTPTDPPVSAEDQDPADPTTWVIDGGAVGEISLGDDYLATAEDLGDGWDETCEGLTAWGNPELNVFFVAGSDGTIETITVEGLIGDPSAGPRTPDGIGLGSTRDEVRTAYPTVEEVAPAIGDGVYLRQSDDDPTDGARFFEFAAGDDRVSSITLTTRDEPPYEPCA